MNETTQTTLTMGRRFVAYLPTLALILVCLAVGLAAAALFARGVRWFVRRSGLEAFAERLGAARLLYAIGLQDGVAVQLGRLAFVVGALLTLLTVAELAGLTVVADGLTTLTGYVPRALIAFALLIGGLWLADAARAVALRAGRRADGVEAPEGIGVIVYYAVLVCVAALIADQLGLETDLLNGLIQIVVAALAVGFVLSLALAARGVLAHVVARIYAARMIRPGDRVEIDGPAERLGGEVVRFGPAVMVVRDAEGREHIVPCGRLFDGITGLERTDDGRTASPPSQITEKTPPM